MTAYLQHRSDDYRIFSLEVVGYAHGEYLNCDDLACTARRTVHAWIARNEELGKLVHEFTRRIGAAPHELRAIRESSEEFWAPRRGDEATTLSGENYDGIFHGFCEENCTHSRADSHSNIAA